MESLITLIVSSLATVISSAILFVIKNFLNRQKKRDEEREAQKSSDTALILRSLNALGRLTVATAISLRDGRTDGELSAALGEYEKVEKQMYEHLIDYHSKFM